VKDVATRPGVGYAGAGADKRPPGVSIVIPTHRSDPPFLAETLASVVAQDYLDWEVVVVDDGCPDPAALAVLAQVDPRVRVVRTEGGGAARARNLGLHEARGDLVAFLDHDDVWYPQHLSTLVQAMSGCADAVGAYTGFDVFEGQPRRARETHRPQVQPTRCTIFSGGARPGIVTLLARRDDVIAVGGFNPVFSGADDVDLIYKLVERGRFVPIDIVTVGYRWHEGNWSRDTRAIGSAGDRFLAAHIARVKEAGDHQAVADITMARKKARRYYAGVAVKDAFSAARSRMWRRAASLALWAVRFSPSGALAVGGAGLGRRLAPAYRRSAPGPRKQPG
jgi:glycosyltransferase involved in cell wall biosynthesis